MTTQRLAVRKVRTPTGRLRWAIVSPVAITYLAPYENPAPGQPYVYGFGSWGRAMLGARAALKRGWVSQ